MNVEKISAITLKVKNTPRSVRFCNEIFRLEIIDGGPKCLLHFAAYARSSRFEAPS
jgi:hypothetical protein